MALSTTGIGFIATEPELKEFQGKNFKILEFRISTDRFGMFGKSNKDKRDFFQVSLFLGERAQTPSLQKGERVFIEGKIVVDEWEKNGKKNYRTSIKADRVRSLTPREKREAPRQERKEPSYYEDDDIPF